LKIEPKSKAPAGPIADLINLDSVSAPQVQTTGGILDGFTDF
jgi:hypothetical protein